MPDTPRGSAATHSSAHLARLRAHEVRWVCIVFAALAMGIALGLLVGYTLWGTVEVICGG